MVAALSCVQVAMTAAALALGSTLWPHLTVRGNLAFDLDELRSRTDLPFAGRILQALG